MKKIFLFISIVLTLSATAQITTSRLYKYPSQTYGLRFKHLYLDSLLRSYTPPVLLDTTAFKLEVVNSSGYHFKTSWPSFGGVGSISLAPIGSSPNANGATVSGSTLNLEPASSSYGGIVTTGTQTIPGAKTFTGSTTLGSSSLTTPPLTLDASSSTTDYLFRIGKNGNPAYFRIDANANISDIGGYGKRIVGTAGGIYFPDGISFTAFSCVNDGNAIFKADWSNLYPFVIYNNASTINGQTGFVVVGNTASSRGPIQEWYDGTFGTRRMSLSASGVLSLDATPLTYTSGGYDIPVRNQTSHDIELLPFSIASGTYTPTLTNSTNVASSTAYVCQYTRIGNVVTVSGKVTINPTGTGQTVLSLSLPVSTANFTAQEQLGGTAVYVNGSAANNAGRIWATTSAQTAALVYYSAGGALADFAFTFQYTIQQ